MEPHHWTWITWAFGLGTGWTLHKMWARRLASKRRTNWDKGQVITMSSGERLLVVDVDDGSPSGSKGDEE